VTGRRAWLVAVSLVVVLAAATRADAKTARDFPYAYDPVWSTVVRFLRVDEGLRVIEKDAASGYVLFELTEGKRTFSGAAELIKVATGTRVVLRLAERPAYMELGLLDRLGEKLREELGEPLQLPADAPVPDKEARK
jgi:hypothetical protein